MEWLFSMKTINYDKLTKREKLLYLAGVWEGEGCHAIISNGKKCKNLPSGRSFRIMISMTDFDIIERFKNFFDYGNITTHQSKKVNVKGLPYKMQYKWNVRGEKGFNFLKQMYPFFGERRKKKLRECYIEMVRRKRK
jgi:hypothetical protein